MRDAHLRTDRLHARPERRAAFPTLTTSTSRTLPTRCDWSSPPPASRLRASREPRAKHRRLIEHVRTLYRKDDLTALLAAGRLRIAGSAGRELQTRFHAWACSIRSSCRTARRCCPPNPADAARPVATGSGRLCSIWMATVTGGFHPGGRFLRRRTQRQRSPRTVRGARSTSSCPAAIVIHSGRITIVDYDGLRSDLLDGRRRRDAAWQNVCAQRTTTVCCSRAIMTDPNRNRTEVAFDALGMVVGTAVMGKPPTTVGDMLAGFSAT